MGSQFHALFDAVSRVMAQTPRSSSLVENLNSRLLLTYFHAAPPPGQSVPRLAAVLPRSPVLHAQPARRAPRLEPPRSDDRPRPSDAARPRTTSASARLTRRAVNAVARSGGPGCPQGIAAGGAQRPRRPRARLHSHRRDGRRCDPPIAASLHGRIKMRAV
jgi:hypothetical protein